MDDPTNTTSLPALDGSTDIAAWVHITAALQGIESVAGPLDDFVAAASRLSDAGADLDPIETLLTALSRAGILTGTQSVLLHAAYLRQRADRFAAAPGSPDAMVARTETRRRAVQASIASARIEGGEPEPVAVALAEQWATGELELDEVIRRLHALYARA